MRKQLFVKSINWEIPIAIFYVKAECYLKSLNCYMNQPKSYTKYNFSY